MPGTDIPIGPLDEEMDDVGRDDDLIPPNERRPQRLLDSRIQADGELSDSDDEGEGGRRDHARHKSRERESPSTGPKFGLGVGILNSVAATQGAGPSSHGMLSRALDPTTAIMDIDSARASDTPRSSLPPRSPQRRSASLKSPAAASDPSVTEPITFTGNLDMQLDESATRSSMQTNGNGHVDAGTEADAESSYAMET